jgi:hypothetical protein
LTDTDRDARARLEKWLADKEQDLAELFEDSAILSALAKLKTTNSPEYPPIKMRLKERKVSIRDVENTIKPIVAELRAKGELSTENDKSLPKITVDPSSELVQKAYDRITQVLRDTEQFFSTETQIARIHDGQLSYIVDSRDLAGALVGIADVTVITSLGENVKIEHVPLPSKYGLRISDPTYRLGYRTSHCSRAPQSMTISGN